jgi:hypothetical protein
VKNVAKGEDVIKENTDKNHGFIDEFLEEAMKSSSIYETFEDVDVDMNIGHQIIMLMQHIA